jgi:flagellin-like hook-associated protein FlgL
MLSVLLRTSAAFQLAGYYKTNKQELADSLLRLVSGKKMSRPSDDIGAYLRAQSLQSQYDNWQPVKDNLANWTDTMDATGDTASAVYDLLDRMNELVNLSNQTSDDDLKRAYNTEFHQLANDVQNTMNSTEFNDYSILLGGSPMATVNLDPTGHNQLDLNIPEIIDETAGGHVTDLVNANIGPAAEGGDTAAALSAVSTAITDTRTFQGTVAGYKRSLQAHVNIADSIMQNSESARSSLTDSNEVEDMMNFTTLDIRQQTLVAMLAQGNVSQNSLLMLYGLMKQ